MPAGTTAAPRRIPGCGQRLTFLITLPQGKIAGITLAESRQVAVTKLSRERCEERACEGRAMRSMDVLEVSGTGCARCGVALRGCARYE